MIKLQLTTKIAMELSGKTINHEGIEYHIDTSTYKKNGETLLGEMTVDAFENGEWVHELSGAYHENQILNSEEYEGWLMGLI